MIRKSKESAPSDEILVKVMEALCIDEIPELDCNLWNRKTSSLIYCTGRCKSPCSNFIQFEFITLKCANEACTPSSPCITCLDEIEDMKTLIAAMHILKSNMNVRQRIVSWNAWCNKMKKRFGNG